MGKRKLQTALGIFLVALTVLIVFAPAVMAGTDYNSGRTLWYNKWHQECDGRNYPAGHWCTMFKQKCASDNGACYDWWNYNGRPYENSYIAWDWWDKNCPHDRAWYDRYCRDNSWNQQNNDCCKYMYPKLYGTPYACRDGYKPYVQPANYTKPYVKPQPYYNNNCRYHSSAISYDWWWNNCPRYNSWYDQYCRYDGWNQRNNMCCVFQYPRLYGQGICTD